MDLRKLNVEVVDSKRLLFMTIIVLAHLALMVVVLKGDLIHWGSALTMWTIVMFLGISFGYHRLVSHRSIRVPKAVEFIVVFLGGLAMQGSPLTWAAVHRTHHKYSDTEKDPHSPYYANWIAIQITGYVFREINIRPAAELLRTGYKKFDKYYLYIYIPIITIPFLFMDPMMALSLFWVPVALTWQLQSLVNTISHNRGRGDPSIGSTNVPWIYPFVLGDCWHRNHHDKPDSVRFHKYDVLGLIAEKLFSRRL